MQRDLFKRVNAQNLQSSVQRSGQFEFLVQDGNEHVNADCDPDLGLHRVGRSAEEVFDAQVLFDPAEEELDLPAVLVKRGDGRGRHLEMIGEKTNFLPVSGSTKRTRRNGQGKASRALGSFGCPT